jgi:hypothetical protein
MIFDGLLARVRIDVLTIKNAAAVREFARTLFYASVPSTPSADGSDIWAPVRATELKRSDWQIYDHCAAFTRLYAVYEVFVADLVSEYLQTLPQLYTRYDELPESVLRQHRVGFGQILLKLGIEGPFRHLKEAEIVGMLSNGLTGGTPYSLLKDAFFVERQNYRADVLSRVLATIGVEEPGRRMAKHPKMTAFLEEKRGDATTFESELSRFVQIRNEAAHGEVESVVATQDFYVIADFVMLLCEIVADVVARQVVDRRLALGQYLELGVVEHVYHQGTVAILRAKQGVIAVGDALLIVRGKNWKHANVRAIQINDRSISSFEGHGEEIGIEMDQKCQEGASIRVECRDTLPEEQQRELFKPEDYQVLEEDLDPPTAPTPDESDSDVV